MKNYRKFIKHFVLINATIFIILLVYSIKVQASVEIPDRPGNLWEYNDYVDELLDIIYDLQVENANLEAKAEEEYNRGYDRGYSIGYYAGYNNAKHGDEYYDEDELDEEDDSEADTKDDTKDTSTDSQTKTKIITKYVEVQPEPVQYNGNELIVPISNLGNYEWEIGYRCPLNPDYIILHGGTLWEVKQKTLQDIVTEASNVGQPWKQPSE